MFQIFNQFLILATLLSIRIGGLAIPVCCQSKGPFAIVNLDSADEDLFCLSATNNSDGSAAEFGTCVGNGGQAWILYPIGTEGNTTLIQNQLSKLCLTSNTEDVTIQMQPCAWKTPDPNQEWVIDKVKDQITSGDDVLCMEADGNNVDIPAFCEPGDSTQKLVIMDLSAFQE